LIERALTQSMLNDLDRKEDLS